MRIFRIKILYFQIVMPTLLLCTLSCTDAKQPHSNGPSVPLSPVIPKKTIVPPQPPEIDYPEGKQEHEQFMAKPFIYYWGRTPTVNSILTAYYGGFLPQATVLADYDGKPFKRTLLAVNFGSAFEKNLPKEMLAELEARKLNNKKLVDIAWVIQPLARLGGNSDGLIENITYLKAHGWADPTSKGGDMGSIGVDRAFLYGIYDADIDISHEVQLSTLKPFRVYTHDGAVSPQTAALHLPNAAPDSMAFWSLVIDHQNPEGKIRAIATLHWLISDKDLPKWKHESYATADVIDHKGETWENMTWAVPFATIGAYITMLKSTSFLKNSSLVKKLEALIKP